MSYLYSPGYNFSTHQLDKYTWTNEPDSKITFDTAGPKSVEKRDASAHELQWVAINTEFFFEQPKPAHVSRGRRLGNSLRRLVNR